MALPAAAGLDITAYWRTLSAAGITAQRLASFDRPIVSEPRFSGSQVELPSCPAPARSQRVRRLMRVTRTCVTRALALPVQAAGLQRDLSAYLATLKAVHGGDDVRSAADAVLGFEAVDMKGGSP